MDFPPVLRAILWLDAVLLLGAGLALTGKPPVLAPGAELWTWLALAGSTLTAVLAVLSAFHLSARSDNPVWSLLPAPACVLWIAASGLGVLTAPARAETWGDTLAEAGECLGFLLMAGLPLLALIVFMLWRAAPRVSRQVLAMAALASAGAAASLLGIVHPHAGSALDLLAHAVAIGMLGIAAAAARLKASVPARA